MKRTLYLVFNKDGIVRTRKESPWLNKGEIYIKLNLDIPNSSFTDVTHSMSIKVPERNIVKPEITLA